MTATAPAPAPAPAPKPKRKRAAGILIRATPEERAELQAAADRDGQSLQAWLLSRALRAARRA